MQHPIRAAKESMIHGWLVLCALISLATMAGIIYVLVADSIPFFREISLIDFLTGTVWAAQLEPRHFGVLPLLCGTVLVAVGALLFAVPIGLSVAIYLNEYAPMRLRGVLKPLIEILAGVPTVVYGYFALTFVTPVVLKDWLGLEAEVFNALSAAIVVGIMVIPTIASLCDDALRAVPNTLREGAYALSATRLEVTLRVVVPGALSGIVAACLLALARAIGETMAVALAAGATPQMTLNPLESIQTMTSYIVQVTTGDTEQNGPVMQSVFAVGLTLFLITLAVNVFAQRMIHRMREVYE